MKQQKRAKESGDDESDGSKGGPAIERMIKTTLIKLKPTIYMYRKHTINRHFVEQFILIYFKARKLYI